ncbi:MAG: NAD-binding protein [Gemmatimonadota bacterium]
MKFLSSQLAFFFQSGTARRNLRVLRHYFTFLLLLIVAYSVLFQVIMSGEGQAHSWITGLYWTLVTMTTLGYGDILFVSDLGRAFSAVVLLSGVLFLLVVLPFTFIQFFYAPWLEAQSHARAPRKLPTGTHGHVIISHLDPVAMSLIERLRYNGYSYVVLEPDLTRALTLHDEGIKVLVGERDDMETYRRARAADAALLAATGDDFENTNIVYTTRELTRSLPIAAIARSVESVDVIELAGANRVVQLPRMLGRALARRSMGGDVRANVIGRFGELLVAESPMIGTPWIGKTVGESRLRDTTGLTIVGVWQRGEFALPTAETRILPTTVLVLAGSDDQFARFTELTVIYSFSETPVLLLGGGRVGRAAAAALRERDIPYRIVEKDPTRIRDDETYVLGSAADLEVLQRAGIEKAPTVIVTTNDDATNIYLTIYCRSLRPDVQLISRATLERNVSTLHRAGADFVMSYASMGANAVYNLLEKDDVVMLAEGLDIFRHPVPPELQGVSLLESGIRESTKCSVVAIEQASEMVINPPASFVLPSDAEMILIGSTEGEHRFLEKYGRTPGHVTSGKA